MKKGFTLTELLAVIIIIGVVSLLVIPTVIDSIKKSKEKLYAIQIADIEKSAKKWATENIDLMDSTHLNPSFLPLESIQRAGYFDNNDIKNPITKEKMDGCVRILYEDETSQYLYEYEEKSCELMAKHGWIYTFTENNWSKTEKNSIVSAGIKIVNDYMAADLIKTEGQTTSGLYMEETRYVFRGSSVDNYAKFSDSSETWRILNIDKDGVMRLMLTTPITNAWDNDNNVVFENSSVATAQLDTYYQNSTSSIQKIINKVNEEAIWHVGNVTGTPSYVVLRSLEAGRTAYGKLGLLNVSDYVIASTDMTCQSSMGDTCKNENYLYTLFQEATTKTTWTINGTETEIWTIDQNGNFASSLPSNTYSIYPVIELKSNAYIESGDGKVSSPYIIK